MYYCGSTQSYFTLCILRAPGKPQDFYQLHSNLGAASVTSMIYQTRRSIVGEKSKLDLGGPATKSEDGLLTLIPRPQ